MPRWLAECVLPLLLFLYLLYLLHLLYVLYLASGFEKILLFFVCDCLRFQFFVEIVARFCICQLLGSFFHSYEFFLECQFVDVKAGCVSGRAAACFWRHRQQRGCRGHLSHLEPPCFPVFGLLLQRCPRVSLCVH